MQTWFRLIALSASITLTACVNKTPAVSNPASHSIVQSRIAHYAKKHNVPVSLALNIAQIESNYRCEARSHVGALGPMQVMPTTAAKHGFSRAALRNCNNAIEAGMLELRHCHSLAKGNLDRIAACYNAGPGSLRWHKLPLETRNYQRKLRSL